MWTYRQATGLLDYNGLLLGHGYSGHGKGLNNPAMQQAIGVGPIPQGLWQIGPWEDIHPRLGPCIAHLQPAITTNAYGRTGFFIHGDNKKLDRSGSDGCIVLGYWLRQRMRQSQEAGLEVVSGS